MQPIQSYMMRTSTPAARRSSRMGTISAVSRSCSQMKYCRWMKRCAPARSSLRRANFSWPVMNSSTDAAGSTVATFSLVIAREIGHGDGAGPLAPEALGGAGVALVDRRHLLGLDSLERLDPALALRHDLPVAAEEDVEEDADERQEDEDEQPGERDRRLAVVHDEQDDRERPVDEEEELEPAGQQMGKKTLDMSARYLMPGVVSRRRRSLRPPLTHGLAAGTTRARV